MFKYGSHGHKRKESASVMQGPPAKYSSHHCQHLNKVWEEVDPGSTPSGHSDALHTPELLWVGPAFPPAAQSLLLAVT